MIALIIEDKRLDTPEVRAWLRKCEVLLNKQVEATMLDFLLNGYYVVEVAQ